MPCFLWEEKNNQQTSQSCEPCKLLYNSLPCKTSLPAQERHKYCSNNQPLPDWIWGLLHKLKPYLAPLSMPRTCDYTGLRPRGEPTSVNPLMRNSIKQIPNDLLEGPYISSSQPSSEKFTCRRYTTGHSAENKRLQNVQLYMKPKYHQPPPKARGSLQKREIL